MNVVQLMEILSNLPEDADIYVEVKHSYPEDEDIETVFLEVCIGENKIERIQL